MRTNSKNGIPTIKARVLNIHRENRNMQIKTTRVQNSFLSMLFLMSFGAGISQAAISACSTTGTAITGYSGASNGCATLDLSFQNIVLVSAGSSGSFGVPTAASTNFFTTSTSFTGNTATPLTATFGPGMFADWDGSSGGATSSLDMTITGSVTANSSGTYNGGSYTQPLAGYHWALTSIALNAAGTTSGGVGNSMLITQTICLNTTAFSSGCGQRYTLTATWGGAAVSPTLGCAVAAGSGASCSGSTLVISPQTVTAISFQTVVALDRVDRGVATLTSFGNTLNQSAQTPEPGTFGMLSAALVGLGVLAKRRKKA